MLVRLSSLKLSRLSISCLDLPRDTGRQPGNQYPWPMLSRLLKRICLIVLISCSKIAISKRFKVSKLSTTTFCNSRWWVGRGPLSVLAFQIWFYHNTQMHTGERKQERLMQWEFDHRRPVGNMSADSESAINLTGGISFSRVLLITFGIGQRPNDSDPFQGRLWPLTLTSRSSTLDKTGIRWGQRPKI